MTRAAPELVHACERFRIVRVSDPARGSALEKRAAPGSPEALSLLRREAALLERAAGEGVVRVLDRRLDDPEPRLLLEDLGGETLAAWRRSTRPGPRVLLELALRLAEVLERIHEAGVVHGGLTPERVLWVGAPRQPVLVGFAEGFPTTRPPPAPAPPDDLARLAWIAPEQTGRLSVPPGPATDLYRLGAVLAFAMGGRPPFVGDDPLEVVHAHLALPPDPPAGEWPPLLWAITERLLAKSPADRYPSARALRVDLEEVLAQERRLGAAEPFVLAQADLGARLARIERLHGRERELRLLQDAFERVRYGAAEVVVVAGPSGSGRTAILEWAARHAGRSGIPVARAAGPGWLAPVAVEVLRSVLALEPGRLEAWRRAVAAALGPDAPRVFALLPEAAASLGVPGQAAPPPDPDLLARFLSVAGTPDRPQVVLLDGELAGLERLEGARHLLVVARTPPDPGVSGVRLPLHVLAPRELEVQDIAALCREVLRCGEHRAAALAETVLQRVGGLPGDVRAFLLDLERRGILVYRPSQGRWSWRIDEVQRLDIGPHLARRALLALEDAPEETREVLAVLAALDGSADRALLTALLGRDPVAELRELEQAGLACMDPGAGWSVAGQHLRMAVLERLEPEDRAALHLRIARHLLAHLPAVPDTADLQRLLDHATRAGTSSATGAERLAFARACRELIDRVEGEDLSPLLATAIRWIEPDMLRVDPDLAVDLLVRRAREAWSRGRTEDARAAIAQARELVEVPEERALLVAMELAQQALEGDPVGAGERARQALRQLGCAALDGPTPALPRREALEALVRGGRRSGPRDALAARILLHLLEALRGSESAGWQEVAVRLAAHELEVGGTPYAAASLGYLAAALPRSGRTAEVAETALQVAGELAERIANPRAQAMARAVLAWEGGAAARRPGDLLAALHHAMQGALEVGEPALVQRVAAHQALAWWSAGVPLDELDELLERHGRPPAGRGGAAARVLAMVRLAVAAARGDADAADALCTAFVEPREPPQARAVAGLLALELANLAGRFEEAVALARRQWSVRAAFGRSVLAVDLDFHVALALSTGAPGDAVGALARRALRDEARRSPATAGYRERLVRAAALHASGAPLQAVLEAHALAAQGARALGRPQDEALCAELAARWLAATGQEVPVEAYRDRSRRALLRWAGEGALSAVGPPRDRRRATDRRADEVLAVLKASQAIAGVTELAPLLDRLVAVLVEAAGAERAVLVLHEEEGLVVRVAGDAHRARPLHEPLEATREVPATLVRLAARGRQPVVLEDVGRNPLYAAEPYVRQRQPRAVLVAPVLNRNVLVGVIYLENRLTSAVFSPERVEVLELLAGQVAVALDNARLFERLRQEIGVRRQAEEALQKLNLTLERQVARRTAALAAANAELARSNEELARFAHVASHDLKEPLRAVASFTDLLQRRYGDRFDERGRQWLQFAGDGARRMRALIDGLLAWAEVQTRARPAEATDLGRAFEEVRADLRVAIEEVEADVQAEGELPVVVADPVQLRQLLQNLLANAIKFRDPDRRPRVRLRASPEDDGWRVEVEDNGIGIPPDRRERAFQLFGRLHGPGRYEGTGLGLALAQRIVERHGGRIWIEGAPGVGTRVCFVLPRPRDPTDVDSLDDA